MLAIKKQLEFNQFKCLKCQEIILPYNNAISIYRNKNGSIRAAAICPLCSNKVWRFYKKVEYNRLANSFIITEFALV